MSSSLGHQHLSSSRQHFAAAPPSSTSAHHRQYTPSPSPSASSPEEAWGPPPSRHPPPQQHQHTNHRQQQQQPPIEDHDGRSRDLLIETRKLLNILNDENTELKVAQDDIKGQLARKQNEKDRLESDMKKINFNLMEDLRRKSAAVKELERQLALTASDANKESRRSTDSMTRVATLEAENTLLKEQVRSANGRSESLTQQLHLLEDAVGEAKAGASKVSKAGLQAMEDSRKDFMARIQELEREVLDARYQLKEKTCQLEELSVELRSASVYLEDRDRQMHQVQSTSADIQFARQQLFDQSMDGYDTLGAMSNYVRTLQGDCERNESTIDDLRRQLESVKEGVHNLAAVDAAAFAAYDEAIRSGGTQLAREQENVSHLRKEVESYKASAGKLTGQLSQYRTEVTQLTDLFAGLQDAVEEGEANLQKGQQEISQKTADYDLLVQKYEMEQQACHALREEVAKLKGHLGKVEDEKNQLDVQLGNERSLATSQASLLEQRLQDAHRDMRRGSEAIKEERAGYESEIDELRSQLHEHTSTLASALDRLTHTSSKRTSVAPSSYQRTPSSSIPPAHQHRQPFLAPPGQHTDPYHHNNANHRQEQQQQQQPLRSNMAHHGRPSSEGFSGHSSPPSTNHHYQPKNDAQQPPYSSSSSPAASVEPHMNPLMEAVQASSRRASTVQVAAASSPPSTTAAADHSSREAASSHKQERTSPQPGNLHTPFTPTHYNSSPPSAAASPINEHRYYYHSHHQYSHLGGATEEDSATPYRGRSSSGAATNMVGM